jgi:dipeptidyl-peptidase-4
MKIKSGIILLCLAGNIMAFAQQRKAFTLEDVWKNPVWREESLEDINWLKTGSQYSVLEKGQIEVYDLATGKKVKTLLEANRLSLEGKPIDIEGYTLSPDDKKILISSETEPIYRRSSRSRFYLYDLESGKLSNLAEGKKIYLATFSPDAKWVAYGFENNLYMYEVLTGKTTRITETGKPNEIIHGSTDWVYEEEFEFWKAFEWSPDSRKIAFLSFDESQVPNYNMQMWGSLYPKDYTFKYPKAGEKNSRVDVSVYDLGTGKTLDIDEGAENDQYLARFQWTQNAGILSVRRMNRLQNKIELMHIHAETGKIEIPLTETSPAYIDINDDLVYLGNGKEFIWSSDRSGYQHLYLYETGGKLIRQLTTGNWEVSDFLGIDEKKDLLYYLSTEDGSVQRQLFAISKSGKGKRKLSKGAGTHSVGFNPSFTCYIDDYHSASAPSEYGLYQADGRQVKILQDNKALKTRLESYAISPKTFFEIQIPGDVKLNAWMIKPSNFDPQKKYPVLMHCYGGPGHQTVTDAWGGADFFWYQILADKGYIIVSADNRGTGGKGAEFKKATYAQLGKLECEDQTAAARYLQTLPYVDGNRIGIWGWSFGGYLTSLCMTKGADIFKTGIAVAPVTNWRFYDSIYTERYLKLPQENPTGYDDNSPVMFADRLKGKYMLIHGTGDDNVHFQNAVSMVNALVKSNKQFDSFYYPNRNHGIYGGSTRLHLYQMMTDFLSRNL